MPGEASPSFKEHTRLFEHCLNSLKCYTFDRLMKSYFKDIYHTSYTTLKFGLKSEFPEMKTNQQYNAINHVSERLLERAPLRQVPNVERSKYSSVENIRMPNTKPKPFTEQNIIIISGTLID